MTGRLVAEEGTNKGLVLSFEEGEEWTVGRDPDQSTLLVEDPAVSRKHLQCKRTPQGLVIENLSQTNPVLINGTQAEGPQLLRQGDTVKIGGALFRYYRQGAAQVVLGEGAPSEETPSPEAEIPRHNTVFEEEEGVLAEVPFAVVDLNLTPSGRWTLKVISGPNTGAEFSVEKGKSYLLGTDAATCDIIFQDLSVSRQHARLTVSEDETLSIEDLGSRNGTLIEGEAVKEVKKLVSNTVIALGTTSFVAIDRSTEQQTLIPPILTTFGRVVQSQETVQAAQAAVQTIAQEEQVLAKIPEITPPPPAGVSHGKLWGGLVLFTMVVGVLILGGLGISTLFKEENVTVKKVDINAVLTKIFSTYPQLRYTFDPNTGRLMMLGHVLTNNDRNELLYAIQSTGFVNTIDDNIIIDELVWQEADQVLAKNPRWANIAVSATTPGHFLLTGSLKTREEANALYDYLNLNFPYPELLEKKVVVEEDVIAQVKQLLLEKGLREVTVSLSGGEITLGGFIPYGKTQDLDAIVATIKAYPGIRSVRSLVTEQAPEEMVVNLSDQYQVTGYSNMGGKNLTVVINGKILTEGDLLDGMKIISIRPGEILLEKGGTKYKIDYKK